MKKEYSLKCIKCGNDILDEEDLGLCVCEDCDDREYKKENFIRKNKNFKRSEDSKKMSHRTKKRETKPRKELNKKHE